MASGGLNSNAQEIETTIDFLELIHDGKYHDSLLEELKNVDNDVDILYERIKKEINNAKKEVIKSKLSFTLPVDLKDKIRNVLHQRIQRSKQKMPVDKQQLFILQEYNAIIEHLHGETGFIEMTIDQKLNSIYEFAEDPIRITTFEKVQNTSLETNEQFDGRIEVKETTVQPTRKPKTKVDSGVSKSEDFNDCVSGKKNRILLDKTSQSVSSITLPRNEDSIKRKMARLNVFDNKDLITNSKSTPAATSTKVPVHQEIFDFGDCEDFKLFETFLVTTSNDKMFKFDRQNKDILGEMKLSRAGSMCKIGRSFKVGVVQTRLCIAVVSTEDRLQVMYRINTEHPYMYICHLGTYFDAGIKPESSSHFAVSYTDNQKGINVESIDYVRATPKNKYLKGTDYEADSKLLWSSKQRGVGIYSIDYLSVNEIVIGLSNNVVCIDIKGNKSIWEIHLNKNATCVCCRKQEVFVCVKDEGRIMFIDRHGIILKENIINKAIQMEPHSICYFEDTILIKEFDSMQWKSIIHEDNKSPE